MLKRLWSWLGRLWWPERVEVAELREEHADLRAEVRELRRQFGALQEREAVLNAHVLHLARNCARGAGVAVQNTLGAGQGSIPGASRGAEGIRASGDGKGSG